MAHRSLWLVLSSVMLVSAFSGCQSESDDAESAADIPLPELSLGVPEGQLSAPDVSTGEAADLGLRLRVGDRFPLKKTVSQRLTQAGALSESLLEMWLAITVQDARSDQFKLGVEYLAVTYRHSIGGHTVYYDSRSAQDRVHPDALLYHGLPGNGFSFWLDSQNEIVSLEGFDQFLRRCVRMIPEEQRQSAIDKLAMQLGEARIANFIDDSIGLLPAGRIEVGQQWQRSRSILQPLPMELEQTCTLGRLTPETAEVELVGRVHPSVNQSVGQVEGIRLHVTSGQSYGRCVVRRDSGLPVSSEVKLLVDLKVELPDGRLLDQRKEILTSIETFPESGPAIELNSPSHPAASTGR